MELLHAPINAGIPQCMPHDTGSSDGEYIDTLLRKQPDLETPAADFRPFGCRWEQRGQNPGRRDDSLTGPMVHDEDLGVASR